MFKSVLIVCVGGGGRGEGGGGGREGAGDKYSSIAIELNRSRDTFSTIAIAKGGSEMRPQILGSDIP